MRGQGRETGVTAETGERQLSVTLEVRNQLQLHYVNSFRNQSSLAQEQGYFAQSSVEKASASLCQQAVIQGCPVPRVQFSSAAQSSLTLCDPMDCSTPGLPVHHQLQVWKTGKLCKVLKARRESTPVTPNLPLRLHYKERGFAFRSLYMFLPLDSITRTEDSLLQT